MGFGILLLYIFLPHRALSPTYITGFGQAFTSSWLISCQLKFYSFTNLKNPKDSRSSQRESLHLDMPTSQFFPLSFIVCSLSLDKIILFTTSNILGILGYQVGMYSNHPSLPHSPDCYVHTPFWEILNLIFMLLRARVVTYLKWQYKFIHKAVLLVL